jgi:lipopolysaccharide/colanic/teichoic acid biosynthesis glycosyltransferase
MSNRYKTILVKQAKEQQFSQEMKKAQNYAQDKIAAITKTKKNITVFKKLKKFISTMIHMVVLCSIILAFLFLVLLIARDDIREQLYHLLNELADKILLFLENMRNDTSV